MALQNERPEDASVFEKLLIKTKYLVYIPVVSLIFAGTAIMIWTLINFGLAFDFSTVTEKELLIGSFSCAVLSKELCIIV